MKKRLLFTLMAACLAAVVWAWVRMLTAGLPWPVYLHEAGRCVALAGFILLLFQYILSSRIRWIEKGIGLDTLLIIHRRLGVILLALLSAHPFLILMSERLQGYATPMGFLKFLGLVALLLVWITAVSALVYGKIPMGYESWKRIHRVGYVVLPLAFFHSIRIGSTLHGGLLRGFWVILALAYGVVLVGKIRQHYAVRRNPLQIRDVKQETHDVWTLRFDGDVPSYLPGQFMFLQLEKNGRLSAPHPFTIASSPAGKELSISVKAVGDFTSTLKETRPSDPAYVQMPYGIYSFLNHPAERYVFIAGGIGITPFLSMLRYMKDHQLRKEVILLWANKLERDIAFRDELDTLTSAMPFLKVVFILSREKDWPGEKGHVDTEKLKRHVGSFNKGEFFVCGPSPMMADVEAALRHLGVGKRRIHSERFAFC